MNEALSIYSIEEFISHGGERQHYLGDCIADVKAISPADVTEDTEAFRFGRAFHEGLENPNE